MPVGRGLQLQPSPAVASWAEHRSRPGLDPVSHPSGTASLLPWAPAPLHEASGSRSILKVGVIPEQVRGRKIIYLSSLFLFIIQHGDTGKVENHGVLQALFKRKMNPQFSDQIFKGSRLACHSKLMLVTCAKVLEPRGRTQRAPQTRKSLSLWTQSAVSVPCCGKLFASAAANSPRLSNTGRGGSPT